MLFTKMHGTGNDFVVIDARVVEQNWETLARSICDRHFGVGADGIILICPSDVADLRMRMFNPDGSEAEMCGNGIRCFAKYVLDREIIGGKPKHFKVETLAGVLPIVPSVQGGKMKSAQVGMGIPRLRSSEIPVDPAQRLNVVGSRMSVVQIPSEDSTKYFIPSEDLVVDWPLLIDGTELKITGVSMGNPHAIAFVESSVDDFPLDRIGPMVEHHPMFPQRVNFEIVNVLDRHNLRVRVWERGAGMTMACGSGASAVAVAARLHDYVDKEVEITLPGGILSIYWDGEGEVFLTGPAIEVFQGNWQE
jgi:diaminopimelate epimerase